MTEYQKPGVPDFAAAFMERLHIDPATADLTFMDGESWPAILPTDTVIGELTMAEFALMRHLDESAKRATTLVRRIQGTVMGQIGAAIIADPDAVSSQVQGFNPMMFVGSDPVTTFAALPPLYRPPLALVGEYAKALDETVIARKLLYFGINERYSCWGNPGLELRRGGKVVMAQGVKT
jgi:hypothetical protein